MAARRVWDSSYKASMKAQVTTATLAQPVTAKSPSLGTGSHIAGITNAA